MVEHLIGDIWDLGSALFKSHFSAKFRQVHKNKTGIDKRGLRENIGFGFCATVPISFDVMYKPAP